MIQRLLLLPVALVALAAVAACDTSNSPTSPSTYQTGTAPYSTLDLVTGGGDEAVAGKTVVIGYNIWLYGHDNDGSLGPQVGTSYNYYTTIPKSFVVGKGEVIRGLDEGVVGMRVGGTRQIIIPPDMAYGSSGNGTIPPNATLVFSVDLLGVQ